MERKPTISRRDFLRLALVGGGLTLGGYGLIQYIENLNQENQANNGSLELESVDDNFYRAEAVNIPTATATVGAWATATPYPDARPTLIPTEPPEELKPLVNQFTIAERINLASAEPMKWLFILPDNKAILTPIAKPYAYSTENENNNIFDWHNHTTYSYLEDNGTPILWGHEGLDELFFNALSDYLRKPFGGGWVTRQEATEAMHQNLLGGKVYLMQANNESFLPKTVNDVNFSDTNIRVVEMQVMAGLLVPRWQNVDIIDDDGYLTPESQVTFDGTGRKIDWISRWYINHTMDIYQSIKNVYPDSPLDLNHTHRQFLSLPDSSTLGVKFCMRPLSDDESCSVDADGNSVIQPSYGRFIMALKAIGATDPKIPSWAK